MNIDMDNLVVSLDHVREMAVDRNTDQPGIYFLLLKGRVVYVGMSRNLPIRLNTHRQGSKIFDQYAAFPLSSVEEALKAESANIRHYRPAYNDRDSGTEWVTERTLARRAGARLFEVRELVKRGKLEKTPFGHVKLKEGLEALAEEEAAFQKYLSEGATWAFSDFGFPGYRATEPQENWVTDVTLARRCGTTVQMVRSLVALGYLTANSTRHVEEHAGVKAWAEHGPELERMAKRKRMTHRQFLLHAHSTKRQRLVSQTAGV